MIRLTDGIQETVAYDVCKSLKLYQNEEAEGYPLHWHTAPEMILSLRSTYTVSVDNTPVTLEEGQILFLAPGVLHSVTPPATGEHLVFLFDDRDHFPIPEPDSLLRSLPRVALITPCTHPLLHRELTGYLGEIQQEYASQLPLREIRIHALFVQVLIALSRSGLPEVRTAGELSRSRPAYTEKFMQVCHYIRTHCTEDLEIEELAHRAGFSRFHFNRLFKQYTGMTCYGYLTRERLSYAKKLLLDPSLSITEVAMCSGFNSLSTFNRLFKTATQCTPSQYKLHGGKG